MYMDNSIKPFLWITQILILRQIKNMSKYNNIQYTLYINIYIPSLMEHKYMLFKYVIAVTTTSQSYRLSALYNDCIACAIFNRLP